MCSDGFPLNSLRVLFRKLRGADMLRTTSGILRFKIVEFALLGNNLDDGKRARLVIANNRDSELTPLHELLDHNFTVMLECFSDSLLQSFASINNRNPD